MTTETTLATDGLLDDFHSTSEVREKLEGVLARSVADETEIVWFERRHHRVEVPEGSIVTERPRLTVLLRVIESGRAGWYRTDGSTTAELESGLRQALAMSRVADPAKKRPVLPRPSKTAETDLPLADPVLLRLRPEEAVESLGSRLEKGESASMDWNVGRLVIANSHDLFREATATEATIRVRTGTGGGHAAATGSARTLEELRPDRLFATARARRPSSTGIAELPEAPFPVVLSPEAVIELLHVLNTHALAGRTYLDGTSFLTRHRKVQVFDRTLGLVDDALRPGLPFPFDLEGSRKRPIDLIVQGTPSQLALDRTQSAEAGLRPTAQAVGGGDALFGNLFLNPGDATDAELLRHGDGGLWIGELDAPECFDSRHLVVRTVARDVARIEGGKLVAAVPDAPWETSLLRVFSRLRAIGTESVVRAMPSTPLGGISAPGLVLEDVEGLGES